MSPWERWTLRIFVLLVSITGILYFWMRYLLSSNDPFSVVNHPWEPLMLQLHVLTSPMLLFIFGVILNGHILRNLRRKNGGNQRSGWTALLSFALMSVSGYLLQTLSDPLHLQIALLVHLGTGGLFVAAFLVHEIIGVQIRRTAGRRQQESANHVAA